MLKDVALVGGGYWGKNLARNLNDLGVLSQICDSSDETLSTYSTGYESVQKTKSFESVLRNNDINKVFIAAPAALHFQLAKQAIDYGKDVFVEKPLCLKSEEGLELVELAKQHQKILMVGHLLQYHPCIDKIKSLLADGVLGQLQYLSSTRLNLGKIRREENALWSFAPHDLSVILSLVGDMLPEKVQCTGGAWLNPHNADTTLTSMKFQGNIRAHVFVSWLFPYKEQKLTVVGSDAMLVFDDTKEWKDKLLMYSHDIQWKDGLIPTAAKAESTSVLVKYDEPLKIECKHFLECCTTRREPKTSGYEGVRVLKVLERAQKSMEDDGMPS